LTRGGFLIFIFKMPSTELTYEKQTFQPFQLHKHVVIGWGFGCGSAGAALANNIRVFAMLKKATTELTTKHCI